LSDDERDEGKVEKFVDPTKQHITWNHAHNKHIYWSLSFVETFISVSFAHPFFSQILPTFSSTLSVQEMKTK
jgi:hypothetical protein